MKASEIRRLETWKPGFSDAMLKEIASQLAEIHELLEQRIAEARGPLQGTVPIKWYAPTEEGGEPRQLRVGPPPAKKAQRKGGKL